MSATVGLYYVRWDGGQIIDTYNGGPVPLVAALEEFYGTGGVSIHRADGTCVIDNAGNSVSFTHLPSGRHFARRTRRTRR